MSDNLLQNLLPSSAAQPINLLDNLRDIHLPADPSWWPLAIGWWFILFIILGLSVWLFSRLKKQPIEATDATLAEQYKYKLNTLLQRFEQHHDESVLLQDCSILLRQLSIEQDSKTTNITGSKWLHHLDSLFASNAFTDGIGQLFADGHYQANIKYDTTELITLMRNCLHELVNKEQVKKQHV